MFKRDNIELFIFLLTLFFLRFPSLYLLGIKNTILTTQFISISIIILLFLFVVYKCALSKKILLIKNTENFLIVLFFISQSLSILPAQDATIFFQRYSKLVLGIIIFMIARFFLREKRYSAIFKKAVLFTLFLGSLPALFLQILSFFSPVTYLGLGRLIISKNILQISESNIEVGKILDDSFLEIVVPIVTVTFILSKKLTTKLICFFVICLVGFLSFASNFRYRLVAFVFGVIISLVTFGKISLKQTFIAIIALILLFFIGDSLVQSTVGYSIIDRFLLANNIRDESSLAWRERMFGESIQMAKSNPFGVGLGNFYYNLTEKTDQYSTTQATQDIFQLAVTNGPHNIFFQLFAETGIFGLTSFIILLGYFIKKDISALKKGVSETKIAVFSFWTLIIICQFFPSDNLAFYTMFFLLRALI